MVSEQNAALHGNSERLGNKIKRGREWTRTTPRVSLRPCAPDELLLVQNRAVARIV